METLMFAHITMPLELTILDVQPPTHIRDSGCQPEFLKHDHLPEGNISQILSLTCHM